MANALIPNMGETRLLNILFTISNAYQIDLYVSDTTPSETDHNLTHTVCSTSGYSPYQPATTDWTVTGSSAVATSHQFYLNSGVTVYGVTMKDAVTNALIMAKRFDTPEVIPAEGGPIIITPKFSLLEEV